MLYYPKIPGSTQAPLERCLAFEKYDGTNLHWDWDRDFGWHAFGTRRDTFNLTTAGIQEFAAKHAHLEEAAGVFQQTLAEALDTVLRSQPAFAEAQEVRVFTEFFGPNSFAGLHKADDPKELRLFDVEIVGVGILDAWDFIASFGHCHSARVVYEGKLTGQFMEAVRRGDYGVAEGVVCKGGHGAEQWMVKVKTYAYLEKLRQAFGERWEDYWE